MADESAGVSDSLRILEERIEQVERKIFGQNVSQGKNDGKVADLIFEAKKKLKDTEAKSPVLGMVFKQLKCLDTYLSAEFLEKEALDSNAKADVIISEEQKLQDVVENLKDLDSCKDALDEKRLQDTQEWYSKLEPLVQVQAQQNSSTDVFDEQFTQLLMAYNSIISSLSKQFIQWENVLTQCEIAVDTDQANNDI